MNKTFQQSMSIGKRGEAIAKEYLKNNGWNFIDVSNNKDFQKKDIDFVVEKNEKSFTIDVKTDNFSTGNFFIETKKNEGKNSLGCIFSTEANFWWYIFLPAKQLYIFRPSVMIEHMENNSFREVGHGTTVGSGGYTSKGQLVAIQSAPYDRCIDIETYIDNTNEGV